MTSWIANSVALNVVPHLTMFGIAWFFYTYFKKYKIHQLVIGYVLSILGLTVITALQNISPSTFLDSKSFYVASICLSCLVLLIFGKKIDKEEELKKKQAKANMNRIAEEGNNAFINGQTRNTNPYKMSDTTKENAEYWERGYALAEKKGAKKS